MTINIKKILPIINYIFLFEIISLFGYLLPDFRQISFIVITLLFLFISLKEYRLGIVILLVELIIGSKGYLFYFKYDGLVISFRIIMWIIIMSAWLGAYLSKILITHKYSLKLIKKKTLKIFSSKSFVVLAVLFVFILWGLVSGFLNGNGYSNIFFDFNAWLFFLLVFPIAHFLKLKPLGEFKSNLEVISTVFIAAISWLMIKTYLLLFVFSHNMLSIIPELYRWVRTTGVGEITSMEGGFYRIFFQSHVFILVAFFIFLILLSDRLRPNKEIFTRKTYLLFIFLSISLSVILITFSRSFWVGLLGGILLFYLFEYFYKKHSFKDFIKINFVLLFSLVFSLVVITCVVKFPYPSSVEGFSATSLLSERAKQISGEAGVSSRWLLLPELMEEINKNPILGQGFGATVTYKTEDPRILETSADGIYSTYAFEWGWLDIWLKLGFFGLLSYIILSGFLVIKGLKSKKIINNSLALGFFSVLTVSIFSPYMNHPLGIGFLIIFLLILNKKNNIFGLNNDIF